MDQTKRILIHTANTNIPMSLVIVGVGTKDMTGMTILDADDRSLSLRGVRAKRDIVQFVGEFAQFSLFSVVYFSIADMKETQAAIIETSKYPVRFFHHDFSHILKIILSTDFVEKKGYMYLLLLSYY